jgi:hypothetical protein
MHGANNLQHQRLGCLGNDVHAWTPAMAERIEEWTTLGGRDLNVKPPEHEIVDAFATLESACSNTNLVQQRDMRMATVALHKMRARMWQRDPDLGGAFVSVILLQALSLCRDDFPELLPTLFEVLAETGSTCVQGDSHRLFALGLCALRIGCERRASMSSDGGATLALSENCVSAESSNVVEERKTNRISKEDGERIGIKTVCVSPPKSLSPISHPTRKAPTPLSSLPTTSPAVVRLHPPPSPTLSQQQLHKRWQLLRTRT